MSDDNGEDLIGKLFDQSQEGRRMTVEEWIKQNTHPGQYALFWQCGGDDADCDNTVMLVSPHYRRCVKHLPEFMTSFHVFSRLDKTCGIYTLVPRGAISWHGGLAQGGWLPSVVSQEPAVKEHGVLCYTQNIPREWRKPDNSFPATKNIVVTHKPIELTGDEPFTVEFTPPPPAPFAVTRFPSHPPYQPEQIAWRISNPAGQKDPIFDGVILFNRGRDGWDILPGVPHDGVNKEYWDKVCAHVRRFQPKEGE